MCRSSEVWWVCTAGRRWGWQELDGRHVPAVGHWDQYRLGPPWWPRPPEWLSRRWLDGVMGRWAGAARRDEYIRLCRCKHPQRSAPAIQQQQPRLTATYTTTLPPTAVSLGITYSNSGHLTQKFWPRLRSMWSRVCITVQCPSLPVWAYSGNANLLLQVCCCGLMLEEAPTGFRILDSQFIEWKFVRVSKLDFNLNFEDRIASADLSSNFVHMRAWAHMHAGTDILIDCCTAGAYHAAGECVQCHFVSVRRELNTDFLFVFPLRHY